MRLSNCSGFIRLLCILALQALAKVYGLPLNADAPEPSDITRTGNELTLHFQNAEGGLLLYGDRVNALVLKDSDGAILSPDTWTASVSGSNVQIRLADEARNATKIEFASTPWYQVNLYNMTGIPAMPFAIAIPRE